MAKITLKKDGTIEVKRGVFVPRIIGNWWKQDVWKENGGRRDKSGNKLVPAIYHAKMRNDLELIGYTRQELVNAIKQYF